MIRSECDSYMFIGLFHKLCTFSDFINIQSSPLYWKYIENILHKNVYLAAKFNFNYLRVVNKKEQMKINRKTKGFK